MKDTDLFQAALALEKPWYVEDAVFDAEGKRLDLYLDFVPGSIFACPECQKSCKAHDTVAKTWRHLNFFQHEAYLHARVPRVSCDEHGVKLVNVSWGRKRSGFSLLLEAMIMTMAKQMPIHAIAESLGITDKRLWRVLEHYVNKDLEKQDLSEIEEVGIDETASKRGHAYVSLFVDMAEHKVVYVTEGKDATTLKAFAEHVTAHNGTPEKIKEVSCDMSPAFISGVEEYLPKASITFDKFHVIKLLNKAVDDVRKEERRTESMLKATRYIWLKNPQNLTDKQTVTLSSLSKLNLKTARAYRMKLAFQEAYKLGPRYGVAALKRWYTWAIRSRLQPIIDFAKMLARHWDGIVRWFKTGMTNALLEGLNSLVQAAKARARGYRSVKTFKIMIYLIAGGMLKKPT